MNRTWTEALAFLSTATSWSRTLKLASSIFSPSYQQEQRKQPFAGGYQRLTHQWFHPPLLLYLRQGYLSESCRRLSRIDGKILTFCPVCAPRRPVIYATAWPDRGGYSAEHSIILQPICLRSLLPKPRLQTESTCMLKISTSRSFFAVCLQRRMVTSCFDKTIDALIAFSWYRCEDAKPDICPMSCKWAILLVVADQNVQCMLVILALYFLQATSKIYYIANLADKSTCSLVLILENCCVYPSRKIYISGGTLCLCQWRRLYSQVF